MTWTERLEDRSRFSRTYEDPAHPQRRLWVGSRVPLHYTAATGAVNRVIDATPERVQTASLDGWQITANDWHYRLGQPAGHTTDGWVGFGGRRGAHWLNFRLTRVGYLHWPQRAWQDLGGAPTYDRNHLSQTVQQRLIGPLAEPVNVASQFTWGRLWATPGGGEVSARWRISGEGLKEELILNQAARTWLAANQPPATPLAETYFGFVFQLDWADIPRLVRHNLVLDPASDFDDSAGPLQLQDAAARLLAFLPAAEVIVRGPHDEPVRLPLRQRFWQAQGKHYLLIGAPVSDLNTLPAGDLVFDPSITAQVSNNDDDGFEQDDTTWEKWYCAIGQNPSTYVDRDGAFRFQGVDIPQGATISDATLTLTAASTTAKNVKTTIKGLAEDNAAVWSSTARPSTRTKTTASVDWDLPSSVTDGQTCASPGISTIIAEIVNRPGWVADNALGLVVEERASDTGHRYTFYVYDEDPTRTALLAVTYDTGSTPPPSGGVSAEAPLELIGQADDLQLTVRGHTTQTEPLQAWQAADSTPLMAVSGDGRLQVGDLSLGTPSALIEANRELSLPGALPQRGLQSLGRLTGAITEALAWAVHELEFLGGQGVSGLHAALRARLVQTNSGDASQAELRAGDFEASNQAGSSSQPVGQITGLHGQATNAAGAYVAQAVGVEAMVSNDTGGDLAEAAAFAVAPPVNNGTLDTFYGLRIPDLTVGADNYAIHTGSGRVRLGGVVQGFRMDFIQLATHTTLTDAEQVVAVDATSGPVTISLPTAAGRAGRLYVVKKVDASANTVTVAAAGAETLDGAATQTLSNQWASLQLVSDGSNWLIV